MKILNIILVIVLWNIISCTKDSFNRYGADISPTVTHSYSDVIEKVKFGESENLTISGKIIETCPKKRMLDAGQGLKHRYTDGQVQRLWFFCSQIWCESKKYSYKWVRIYGHGLSSDAQALR